MDLKYDMDRIAEYLAERYSPWGWMGQRAHDAAGINAFIPLELIISCDHGREVPLFFDEKKVFSLEKLDNRRRNWSNEHLKSGFTGAGTFNILEKVGSLPAGINLLCYRSIKSLEKFALSEKSLRLFAPPESLKRKLDNKVLFYDSLEAIGLEKIPGWTGRPDRYSFDQLAGELGKPFVVQYPYGSNGEHTFIVEEPSGLENARRSCPGQKAVIRQYVDGFSLNVNAVIVTLSGSPEVVVSYPSVQITGAGECSSSRTAYCGNDFAAVKGIDPAYLRLVKEQTVRTGKWMAAAGYRGVFGMDFMARDGKLYPVEINPRFQNSTSLYIAMRTGEGGPDILLLNIAEFLGAGDKYLSGFVENFRAEKAMRPLEGAQLVLHNKRSRTVVAGDLRPGIYRNGHFVKGASLVTEIAEEGAMLVTCGVPAAFTTVEPGAPICKIQSRGTLLGSGATKLNEQAEKAVSAVYSELLLRGEDRIEKVGVRK
ncbi:MAG: ATP-grasp domain-containing protein [Candidatus Omnitrophica bacterium]|nr:ATP-grasp domain-containing protein [Candidatus Omnitrophota bacterium]